MEKQGEAEYGQGPDNVEQGDRALRLRGKRVTPVTGSNLLWPLKASEFKNRIQHPIRRSRSADGCFPAEIVPNLAVMGIGLLE